MKNQIHSQRWIGLALFSLILLCKPLIAGDSGSGIYSWDNAHGGDQKIRDAVATCDTDTLVNAINNSPATYVPNGGIGIMNIPNLVFSTLEKNLKVDGATDSVTGHFTYGSDFYFNAKVEGTKGAHPNTTDSTALITTFEPTSEAVVR